MKRKLSGLMALGIALLLLMCGCKNGGEKAAVPTESPKPTVGLVLPDPDGSWEGSLALYAEAALDKLDAPYATLYALSAEEQLSSVQTMLEQGVDAVVLYPFSTDWAQIEPAVELCRKKDVPVVLVGVEPEAEELPGVTAVVLCDDVGAGTLAAEYVAGRGVTHAVVLCDETDPRQVLAADAFAAALPPSCQVYDRIDVPNQATAAAALKEHLLNGDPLQAVYCASDDHVEMVCQALLEMDAQDVDVVGCGGSKTTLAMVMRNHRYVRATCLASPSIAGQAAEMAYRAAQGEAPAAFETKVESALYAGLDASCVYDENALY